MSIQKLDVRYTSGPDEWFSIGTLAAQRRSLYFEYADSFLSDPHHLSPYYLSPETSFHEFKESAHLNIWGLFEDSLPDGWGLLLMDRFFQSQGIPPQKLSVLSRLAYLGSRTMGALTYHPCSHSTPTEQKMIDLLQTANEIFEVLEGKAENILYDLFQLGGSPGGARPKILVGRKGDYLISGEQELPEGFEHWLLKFHAKRDEPEEGIIEQIYADIAREAGLEVQDTNLFFEPKAKKYYFGTRRFDRKEGNRRLHIHSLSNLIHSNFRYPSLDYTNLLEITRDLTKKQTCMEKVFRQMVFNIVMNNRDDHDKNFSFVYDAELKEWSYAPSYDLTFCYGLGRTGEHSMMIAGEGENPSIDHVMKLAADHGFSKKRATSIVDEVKSGSALWRKHTIQYGLSTQKTEEIAGFIKRNCGRL